MTKNRVPLELTPPERVAFAEQVGLNLFEHCQSALERILLDAAFVLDSLFSLTEGKGSLPVRLARLVVDRRFLRLALLFTVLGLVLSR